MTVLQLVATMRREAECAGAGEEIVDALDAVARAYTELGIRDALAVARGIRAAVAGAPALAESATDLVGRLECELPPEPPRLLALRGRVA